MYILGINSVYHDSSICLLDDGVIVAAIEEERLTRIKHAKRASVDNPDKLPLKSIYYCLGKAGITLEDIDCIGFSLNPSKRLLNKDIRDAVSDGDWGSAKGEEIFFQKTSMIPDILRQHGFKRDFLWIDHHLCHAASAFFLAPFQEAAVLTVDGIGEISSTLFAKGGGSSLRILQEITYPNSIGFLWEKIAKFIGFTEYDACKVNGLAAYGEPQVYAAQFREIIRIGECGRFTMNNDILRLRLEDYSSLEELFDIKRRHPNEPLEHTHENIAASLQAATNEAVLNMTGYLYDQTRSENLCMAGGVALNCTTNKEIFEKGPFKNLYIQPAAHDAGTAIGAAFFIWHAVLGRECRFTIDHAYLGPAFSEREIEQALRNQGLVYERANDIERAVALLLSQGNIVAWFQGAMEFGPRALGNRSLLADPRDPNIRAVLNDKTKHREAFRPFAPSVLYEEADRWFEILKPTCAAEFMLLAYPVKESVKGTIPSVVHRDGTSRIQIVRKEINPRYHRVISEFFQITGIPLVLNTSFNDNEPIVCTPDDAVATFLSTKIDYLAISNFLVDRRKQRASQELVS